MNFGLIIIGDEILSGKRRDQHMPKVIELLAARGLSLAWVRYIGDDRARIADELRRAWASGDVVFSCGGIGATPDDHTRQAAADALHLPLLLHPEARALILERVRHIDTERGIPFDENSPDTVRRLAMGEFPQGANIVPNPYNQVPGFSVGSVYFVPGFPVMAHPMIAQVLDTHYAHLHGQERQAERSVIVKGTMESILTPLMEQIEREHEGIKVFSLPSVDHPVYGRHIELGVKGDAGRVPEAYAALYQGLLSQGAMLGPELGVA